MATYTPRLGEPLGPESMTWRLVGDYRWMYLGMRSGLLQTLHPAINRALRDHDSSYFQGPMKRILRSLPQIRGVVYDADPAATGAKVRDYHKPLSGTLRDGSAYHALSPEVFYWPHATFFEQQIAAMEHLGTPLDAGQKEWLFQESVQWYSLYGLSMKPVPANYAEFEDYWRHVVDDVLEINGWVTQTTRTAKGIFGPSPFPFVPQALWGPASDAQFDLLMWITRGSLPQSLRARADIAWTDEDARRLRRVGAAVEQTFGRLPLRARLVAQAREAFRREARRGGGEAAESSMPSAATNLSLL